MNVESKFVRGDVDIYEAFGWKNTETVSRRSGRSSYSEFVLVRDKDHPNYDLLNAYEKKYFALRSQIKTYKKADGLLAFLLFLLLIIPGILYLYYKWNQETKIVVFNNKLRREMAQTMEEAKALL